MKLLLLLLAILLALRADAIEGEILQVQQAGAIAHLPRVDVGVSGFVVRHLDDSHSMIIADAIVRSYDSTKGEANLTLKPSSIQDSTNLPTLKLTPQRGDRVLLAQDYTRGLLIAPNEQSYYTLTRALKGELFIHPDIFAAHLAYRGHVRPLQEDFESFCASVTVGLLFFYIQEQLYTVDCRSFAILSTQEAPLGKQKAKLPFYHRFTHIKGGWFGKGSKEIEDYASYYKKLLKLKEPNTKESR